MTGLEEELPFLCRRDDIVCAFYKTADLQHPPSLSGVCMHTHTTLLHLALIILWVTGLARISNKEDYLLGY
jgi:hypothetical protein